MLSLMKKGSYIVNTARGKIVDRDALVQAVKSNHIQGYAGDVWYPQVILDTFYICPSFSYIFIASS